MCAIRGGFTFFSFFFRPGEPSLIVIDVVISRNYFFDLHNSTAAAFGFSVTIFSPRFAVGKKAFGPERGWENPGRAHLAPA